MAALDPSFDRAVWTTAKALMPDGWIVRPEPIDTLQELQDLIRATGKIVVTSQFSEQSIYGKPGTNWAFRAWHDWCHNFLNALFTPTGEAQVAALQCWHLDNLFGAEIAKPWRDLVEAEVNGQTAYATLFGHFVEDQMTFDIAYIRTLNDPTAE